MRIDHVQLAMPRGSEPQARAFYSDVLGMGEVQKPERLRSRGGCWFELDGCFVHLGVDPDFVPARKAHPAFRVTDLSELAQRLEAAGHSVTWDDRIPGVHRFYTSDLSGNRLEFLDGG